MGFFFNKKPKEKSFDAVMQEITGGLTGDTKKDIAYLKKQCDKYRGYPQEKEIVRACGRLIFNLMPEDKKKAVASVAQNQETGQKSVLEEVRFKMFQKQYDDALALIESLIAGYEEANLYADDAVSEYHCFAELMELVLYMFHYKPEKEVRRSPTDYAEVYLLYGILLFDLNRNEDAIRALDKALKWNPVSVKILFERGQNLMRLGRQAEYENAVKQIFKVAFRPKDLAQCYRGLGFLYSEQGKFELAACCELFSLQFENSDKAQSELCFIYDKLGCRYEPNFEQIKAQFEENNIPLGPDSDMLGLAMAYGKHTEEQKDFQSAAYYYEIANAFLQDKELESKIENLKKQN